MVASSHKHWVMQKDSYRVHGYYLAPYGNVIGSYYLPQKLSLQSAEAVPYTAQCLEGAPTELKTEAEARHYVESCPE